ncbi:MAG: TolC family protein [Bacteroidota bacterium]
MWRYTLYIVLLITGVLPFQLWGQAPDTTTVQLNQERFLEWVLQHHPLVRQANLIPVNADAQLMEARGAFDPKAYADWEVKSFDGKSYFNIADGGIKYPTWFGLELKGAWEQTSGIFLNPERNLPARGQAVLGVKASVLRGLMIDDRRANLRIAQIEQNRSNAIRQADINMLLLEALYVYWDWSIAYQKISLFREALNTTANRLEGIRESFLAGNKPEVDTVETMIQLQEREFDLNQATIDFNNAGLALSNFLWYQGVEPMRVADNVVPNAPFWLTADNLPTANEILSSLILQHPELQSLQLELDQLDIKRKLAAEQLKPKLDVEYNFLGNGSNFNPAPSGNGDAAFQDLFAQNYKWGLQFSFPLFLRKARGKLEQNKVKVLQTEFKLQQKQRDLANKVRQYTRELQNARDQIVLYTQTVANYSRLLEAEIYKFEQGSSSIFLINSREQKLLDAQIKLAELEGKFWQKRASLQYASGSIVAN